MDTTIGHLRMTAPRHIGAAVACLVLISLLVVDGPRWPGVTWERSRHQVSVIVQAAPGAEDEAARAVEAAGGSVGGGLPIVDGFVALLPAGAEAAVAASPAVRALSANTLVRFETITYEDAVTASNFAKVTGATQLWAAGNVGAGVGVAVIDTGISQMPDVADHVVHGPDLSGEGTLVDTHGHGTVMAGLISGAGTDSRSNPGGAHTGVAPRSTLVSVKVAGRNGVVDVSTVLQAMHWVSAYKDQYNIRVLNLSWGTGSTQDPAVDPLNYAVERLWRQGIVVVVAAGNSGPNAGTIMKPGDDPMVITVGAYDDKQTVDEADDALPAWTSRGPTAQGRQKPDLVAPGRTLVAARSYGSAVEHENPKALVSPSYIKGSGTSQAAAVTSGLAALVLAAHPEWTPDQVKSALVTTAAPITGRSATDQGAGRVRVRAAVAATPGPSVQPAFSSGLGSIDASRGGRHVQTDCGQNGTIDVIKGEIDVRCEAWSASSWTGSSWTGSSWTGSSWSGSSWSGSSWTGSSWTGGTWTGSSWTGSSWTGSSWSGSSWSGSSWTGSSWTGSSWTGSSWTSAAYGGDEFLTVFWGSRPRRGQRVPGELSDFSD